MTKLKWLALTSTSGLLLALGSCTTDFVYFIMQALATQAASTLVSNSVSTTTS